MDMRHETEYYRQQLELEHIRQQLYCLRGNPAKPVLPGIGGTGFQQQLPSIEYHSQSQQQNRQNNIQQQQKQQNSQLHENEAKQVLYNLYFYLKSISR